MVDTSKLEELLRPMDLPPHRVEDLTPWNIGWLRRNLPLSQSAHPNYRAAIAEIRRLQREMNRVDL